MPRDPMKITIDFSQMPEIVEVLGWAKALLEAERDLSDLLATALQHAIRGDMSLAAPAWATYQQARLNDEQSSIHSCVTTL